MFTGKLHSAFRKVTSRTDNVELKITKFLKSQRNRCGEFKRFRFDRIQSFKLTLQFAFTIHAESAIVNRSTNRYSAYYYICRAAWPEDEFLIRTSDSPALCTSAGLRVGIFVFVTLLWPLSLPCSFYGRPFSEEICRTVKYLFCSPARQAALDYFAIAPRKSLRVFRLCITRFS